MIKHESPPPGEASRSLLKRSRSPVSESDRGDDKRIKTDVDADVDAELDGAVGDHADTDLDELARMIQNAESSAHDPLHLDENMLDMGSASLDANFEGVLHGLHESEDPNGMHDSEHSKMVDSILASLSQHDAADYISAGSQHPTDPDGSHDIAMSEMLGKKRSLWSNHEHYTRQAQILPTLGRVAVDILRALSEQSLEDTIATLNTESESPIWKEYLELKAFFDTLRKMFSDDFPLLFPDQLEGINTPEEHEMIRVANLATMCASMFGLNELGWPDLNNNFLQNFLAKSCPMTAAVSDLYLVFKTQMFFGLAESNPEASREELLEELFVTGVKDTLQQRHPDLPLTAVETQFLAKSEQRKTMLLEGSHSPEAFQVLTTSYTYEAFLDSLSTHINDCMGTIEKLGTGQPGSIPTIDDMLLHEDFGHDLGNNFDLDAVIAEAAKAAEASKAAEAARVADATRAAEAASAAEMAVDSQENPPTLEELAKLLTEGISRHGQDDQTNSVSEMPPSVASNHENANRVTRLALDHIHHNQYRPTASPQPSSYANSNQLHPPYQAPPQQSQTQQPYYQFNQQTPVTAQNSNQTTPSPDSLPPNQSDSTPALYERARQAAAARSSTHARREGSHSTRRPWSAEEEKALMMGLDMVKGPHWSQILSLFGPHGTMSQILSDRTQVQLKDKARNLKLFFLKTNSEMPYYLQCVTGELKTRAPTQAARKEAEERARLNSQDEQDRINGIMALGNMQGQRTAAAVTAQRSVTPATASQNNHGLPHAHSNMARTGQAQAGAPVQGHTGAQGVARTSTTHPAHYSRPGQPQPGQSQAYSQSAAQQNQQQPPRPPQGQPQGQIAGQSAPRPQGQGQPQGTSQGQVQGQTAGQVGGQAAARPPTQGQPQAQGQGHTQGQQPHGQPQGQAQRQVQGQAPTQAQGQAAQGQAVQGQPQGQGQVHGQHQNQAQGQVQPQQQTRPQGQPQARPQYPVQHPGQPSQQQAQQSHYQQRPQAPNSSQPQTQQHPSAQQQHMPQGQRPQQPAHAHPPGGASQQPPRPQQNVQPQGQMQRPQTQPQAQSSHQAPQGPNHQRHHSQPQPQSQAPGQGQGQAQHQTQPQHTSQHQTQQQSASQHHQPPHQAPRQAQPQQQTQQHAQQPAYRQPSQQHAASQAAPRPVPQTQQPVHQQPAHRPNGQQTGLAPAPAPAPAPAVKEEPVKHEPMDPDEAHLLPIKEALEREARESSGTHGMDHDAHMEPEALAALIAASVSGV